MVGNDLFNVLVYFGNVHAISFLLFSATLITGLAAGSAAQWVRMHIPAGTVDC